MKIIIGLLLFLIPCKFLRSQGIPLETVAGNRYFYGQYSAKATVANSNLGIFNTTSYMLKYNEQENSELMSQGYLTYGINPYLRPGFGFFYASQPGLKPSVNLNFTQQFKDLLIIAVPRTDVWKKPSYDLMLMMEYNPVIAGQWRAYARTQNMFNYNSVQHNRSYQYLRVGLQYKRSQFGVALSKDTYGKCLKSYYNWGIFYKVNI